MSKNERHIQAEYEAVRKRTYDKLIRRIRELEETLDRIGRWPLKDPEFDAQEMQWVANEALNRPKPE
jgi:hypothetical protein